MRLSHFFCETLRSELGPTKTMVGILNRTILIPGEVTIPFLSSVIFIDFDKDEKVPHELKIKVVTPEDEQIGVYTQGDGSNGMSAIAIRDYICQLRTNIVVRPHDRLEVYYQTDSMKDFELLNYIQFEFAERVIMPQSFRLTGPTGQEANTNTRDKPAGKKNRPEGARSKKAK